MLEEIRVKVMERMTTMREFATRWISDVSPIAMGYIEEQSQYFVKHEFKWNGDTGYEIQHGVYKHIFDFSNNTCTCRSWQLKGIPCSHVICAIFFKRFEPADYVTHWYKKETYLKDFSCYIQPVTNMEMWPSTQNPTVEPPVITKISGRPKKNRKRAQDEPKKKFGKISRKGTPMTCSNCKTVGHNKKGCPILKGQGFVTTGTSNAGATQRSQAAQTTAQQSGPTSDSRTARDRNTQPSAVASAFDTGSIRSRTFEDIIASIRGRPTGSGLRGRPRTTGFGILFSDTGIMIERCGARDRVHSSPTKVVDAGKTNIDLGYSAPRQRWQGRNVISQRQLQQLLKRRQIQASLNQPQVHSSSQPSQSPCPNLSQSQQNINQSQP
uniref:Uncharacterized protein LOC104249660 n=1 Tax=Nicotiana sylvestris TaxID=4096 RepID=A0A1U7YK27_NICSY|nr:PREDICTED: uncharacterized protein LOC104249660 [Nicotiana sylvestris]